MPRLVIFINAHIGHTGKSHAGGILAGREISNIVFPVVGTRIGHARGKFNLFRDIVVYIQAGIQTVEPRANHNAIGIIVAYRSAVLRLLSTAADRSSVVVAESGAGNFVIPVRIGSVIIEIIRLVDVISKFRVYCGVIHLTAVHQSFLYQRSIFISGERLDAVGTPRHRRFKRILYTRLAH